MATITSSDKVRSGTDHSHGRGTLSKNILIAVDASEASQRAMRYVGSLLRDTRDVSITLFHVLNPMPRELMEHGGSENPETEERLGAQLRKAQDEWVRTEGALEYPILIKALEQLGQTGFPLERVTLKFGHERDITDTIVDEARGGGYGTIVVARHEGGGARRLFGNGITDRLLRELSGTALWILG